MQVGRGRFARHALSVVMATTLGCALLAATAGAALANGGGKDSYSVKVTPATALAGSSTTFDFALTNTSSPGRSLISAAFTPPLGFRITNVSLPAGAKGHVYVLFNVVLLDRVSVAPGSTLDVAATAIAPSRCGGNFTRWLTVASGGLFGELLSLDPGSNLTTTVTCASALKFGTQPTDSLVGSVITASANNTSGPPVTVDIVDSTGNTVDSSAPVTIALGNNPSGATLGGTTTENAVHGVATFSNLTLNQPDNGYTLVASSSGLSNNTSSSFDENNNATDCPAAQTCTNTLSTSSTSLSVAVGSGATDAMLTESVNIGTPLSPNPGCAAYQPRSPDTYEFVVSAADRAKSVTWTVKNTTTDGFRVCFGAPYEFNVIDPTTGEAEPAPAGTLPDGSPGFVGLLPACVVGNVNIPNQGPCVQSLVDQEDANSTSGLDAVATITIPAGLPGDPFIGR